MIDKIAEMIEKWLDILDKLIKKGEHQPSNQERKDIYDTI